MVNIEHCQNIENPKMWAIGANVPPFISRVLDLSRYADVVSNGYASKPIPNLFRIAGDIF